MKHGKSYHPSTGNVESTMKLKERKPLKPGQKPIIGSTRKKVMYVAGICMCGKTSMYFVPEKSKMNAEFFIKFILTPMIEKNIPRIYGHEKDKVILHFDSASSHVAKKLIPGLWNLE
jgi:hypothetical protein